MSSAILYLAIVTIWAFVLVPRWLRRPHGLTHSEAEEEADQAEPQDDSADELEVEPAPRRHYQQHAAGQSASSVPAMPRSRVLQARRRLLTMLVSLTAVAVFCTVLSLTSWWACIPPAGMLGMYLLLLRETALADAEQAHWRAAETLRVAAARQQARAAWAARVPEPIAQVIDISARVGEQLYDQYADATMRAVGD